VDISKKIIIGGIIIIAISIISSTVVFSMISEQIRFTAIKNVEKANASYLSSAASSKLTVKDFDLQNMDEKKSTFENYFHSIENEETLRIKVWAKDGTIVYSDGSTIVGNNFASNIRFQNSISGQIVSEIKEPIEPENIDEVGYGQLMEIYVPIYLNQPEPVGVIELYFSMDSVNESVNKVTTLVFTIIVILIGLISLSIIIFSMIVVHFSKQSVKVERLATIGEIASRVSHDIRNPLQVIESTISILEIRNKGKLSEKDLNDFKRMQRAISRMTNQVEGVLDFIKESKLELKQVSIIECIKNVLEGIIIPNTIKLKIPENDYKIYADPQKFEIVLANLIRNGVESIADQQGSITIKLSENTSHVMISIIDSGSGIPEENLTKVFEPLFTTKQTGTGLGLQSCKTIIEQHKGNISVKNNPTTFTISFPKNNAN